MTSQRQIVVSLHSVSVPISVSVTRPEMCLLWDCNSDIREVKLTLGKSFPFSSLCLSPSGWRTLRHSLPGNSSRPQTMEQVRPLEEEGERDGEKGRGRGPTVQGDVLEMSREGRIDVLWVWE